MEEESDGSAQKSLPTSIINNNNEHCKQLAVFGIDFLLDRGPPPAAVAQLSHKVCGRFVPVLVDLVASGRFV